MSSSPRKENVKTMRLKPSPLASRDQQRASKYNLWGAGLIFL